jgi:hypothetical protein
MEDILMSVDIEDFKRVKKEAERLKETLAKEEGRRDELMSQLKEKYKCSDVDEAKILLDEKVKQKELLEKEIEIKMAAFREKWSV